MRSVPFLALMLVAGCGDARKEGEDMVTVDLKGSPGAAPPAVPPIAPTPSAASEPLPPVQALGTEPFWSVVAADGTLTWSTPEEMPGTPFKAEGQARRGGWTYRGTLKGEAAELVITPGKCSDGMSDNVYDYTARFVWGAQRLSGCARKR